MSLPGFTKLNFANVGVVLALLIVASAPNFGLKYAMSAAVPSAVLSFMGMWLIWKVRAAVYDAPAQRRWALVALLLFVPILISVPASYDVRYSASVAAAMVFYYFTGAALIHVLQDDTRRHWLLKWILIALIFWIADSTIQYFFGRDLFGLPLTPDGRVTGPFDGNLRQATFLAMLLPLGLGYLLRRNQGGLWALSFFVVAAAVSVLGGVRMVLIMLAVSAIGVFLHLPRSRWKFAALIVVIVSSAASVMISPVLRERLIGQIERVETVDFESLDALTTQRLTIWHTAANMVRERPLSGVGAGAFAKAYVDHSTLPRDMFRDEGVRVFHAHQVYVSFAAETGLPGLMALVVSILLGIRWYGSAAGSRRAQAWPFALSLSVYFFPFNTQPPLFNHWLFPVILLLCAAFLVALDDQRPEPAPGKPDSHGV